MTLLRSLAAGVGAFAIQVVALALVAVVTTTVGGLINVTANDLGSPAQTLFAVLTGATWIGAAVTMLLVATRMTADRLNVDQFWPMIICGLLLAVVAYWVLGVLTVTNACMWDVAFPLGGECWAR